MILSRIQIVHWFKFIILLQTIFLLSGCASRIQKCSSQDIASSSFKSDEMSNFVSLRSEATQPPKEIQYKVWYGTDRVPVDANDYSQGFRSNRDSKIHYGQVNVNVPESHKFGSTGSSWLTRLVKGFDDRLIIKCISKYDSQEAYLAAIKKDLAPLAADERSILVYIHGYNVSFNEAAIRAAQIGVDLQVTGATAFFSWPSMGDLKGYVADGESIQFSEKHIAEFLMAIAQQTGGAKVNILVHSMGNRGFLRALQTTIERAARDGKVKFGQIFLAAPDLDVDLFKQLAELYPQVSERTTLYISPLDKAVKVSEQISEHARVGHPPPVTVVKGIDTIEVKDVEMGFLGHSYFAEAAEVLMDIRSLLDDNKPPDERDRLCKRKTSTGEVFWSFSCN